MGAVDVWYAALTDLEELKLNGTPFCGGVVDIAKLYDQIIRTVVYTMAAYAAMLGHVLVAHKDYIGRLQFFKCLAE